MMNERIRELAEQANKHSLSDVNRDSEFFHTIAMAKFAELIVRECAEVADNADATREKWQSIGKFVREHFGVE
jgi:hypothetical protein